MTTKKSGPEGGSPANLDGLDPFREANAHPLSEADRIREAAVKGLDPFQKSIAEIENVDGLLKQYHSMQDLTKPFRSLLDSIAQQKVRQPEPIDLMRPHREKMQRENEAIRLQKAIADSLSDLKAMTEQAGTDSKAEAATTRSYARAALWIAAATALFTFWTPVKDFIMELVS